MAQVPITFPTLAANQLASRRTLSSDSPPGEITRRTRRQFCEKGKSALRISWCRVGAHPVQLQPDGPVNRHAAPIPYHSGSTQTGHQCIGIMGFMSRVPAKMLTSSQTATPIFKRAF